MQQAAAVNPGTKFLSLVVERRRIQGAARHLHGAELFLKNLKDEAARVGNDERFTPYEELLEGIAVLRMKAQALSISLPVKGPYEPRPKK